MTGPFEAPDAESTLLAQVPFLGAARWTLLVVGAIYVLLGVATAPLMTFAFMVDPEIPDVLALPFGIGMGAFSFVICAGFGALNVVVAWGLGQGARWAWFGGLIIGAIYLGSICLPFGAVILYGVLNEAARDVFLGPRASTRARR